MTIDDRREKQIMRCDGTRQTHTESAQASAALGNPQTRPIRLALAFDYEEEGWPSMGLVGEMIAQ